jgi:Fe-S-cluster containining protein
MEPGISVKKNKTESDTRKPLPCLTFQCSDQCCKYGVDVEIDEYRQLIKHHLAKPEEFTGPEEEDGELVYRTALGRRGCIFLLPTRGCRLHNTRFKPGVCQVFPRDKEEAVEAYQDGYLPCVEGEMASAGVNRRKNRSAAREKSPA